MSLFKSAAIVSMLTFCSRILGYVRDMLIAATMGAGMLADVFLVAFRLPNLFRQLSAEGALNNAFVPMFSKNQDTVFASHVLSWMVLVLVVFTIVIEIFMSQVMMLLAPGFIDDPQAMDLLVMSGRIMFPYLIMISVVSLFNGMLQSVKRFAFAALAPVIVNIIMISCLLWFIDQGQTPVHTLSVAVTIAGVVQVVVLYSAVRWAGLQIRLLPPKATSDVAVFFKRMLPGIIGGGVTQLNLWINTLLATTLSGAVSYLYYADRLVQFPLALIGTALGIALLPALSRQIGDNQKDEAINTQNQAIEVAMLLALPASAGLWFIAPLAIEVIFERGAFTAANTIATSDALRMYVLGLPAFVLIKLYLPAFFAAGDTKTPVKIALGCLVLNLTLNLLLIGPMQHLGLALSTALTAWVNVGLLVAVLTARKAYWFDRDVLLGVIKSVCITGFMVLVLVVFDYSGLSSFEGTSQLGAIILVGVVSYVAGVSVFGYHTTLIARLKNRHGVKTQH